MQRTPRFFIRLLTVGSLAFSFCSASQDIPAAQVEVVEAQQLRLAPSMQLKGNVLALQDAVISSEVDGLLIDIDYVGSVVERDATLAKVDDSRARWALESADADIKALEIDWAFRQSEVERFERLASNDNASKNQLQRELAASKRLEQEIKSAIARQKSAKKTLEDTKIKAPFTGVIAEQFAHQGEYIRVGDPIVRFVNQSEKDLSIRVPIHLLTLLKDGMPISVEHTDHRHEFPIRKVVPIGDATSRMAEIRLNVSDSHLIIGDSVNTEVPVQPPETVIAIPRDAVVIRGNQRFVYVVDDANIAQQIAADIRFADGSWVVLAGGVSVGDKIIIRGAERLQPQSKVSYK